MNLNQPIENLKIIRPSYYKKLHKLGIKTIRNLLYHFPHRYNDFSNIKPIAELKIDETATVQGRVTSIKNIRIFRKKITITEALIKDDTGAIKAVWFNQPFLARNIHEEQFISLSGKLTYKKNKLYLSNPAYEIFRTNAELKHTAGLIPVYPETAGLSSRWLRYIIKSLLKYTDEIPDFLPAEIKKNQKLMNLNQALKQIHFPVSLKAAEQAKKRLVFEELFLMQLIFLNAKEKMGSNALPIPLNLDLIKRFVASLKFKLTNSQRIAAWEILKDVSKNKPMNRLLNGDVGSGKTIVAAIAALAVASANGQIAFMAPTEILARQHFEVFSRLFKKFSITIGLLTNSESKISHLSDIHPLDSNSLLPPPLNLLKLSFNRLVEKGEINIVCGTHALIQDKIKFKNLALAIIDEQHRFGVSQRAKLVKKNLGSQSPHFLSMSATPIPRTLALSIYGDLDISIINEMPKGRQKITTKIIPPNQKISAYEFIKSEIKKRKQVFVICPRIEASQQIKNGSFSQNLKSNFQIPSLKSKLWNDVKTVKEEHKKLSEKIFPEFRVAMIHGKMKPKEKEKTMREFANRKINILVSTSVIEVGIDMPNATVMMIESAERFGLAQLHQFRGRVGRGKDQSYCFLFTESSSPSALERLKIMESCDNGFELAEKDLKIRGPGEFLGTKQSGVPKLMVANLGNTVLIKTSREEAEKIIKKDKNLSTFPLLRKKIAEFQKEIHLE